jgi:hypothetical protein
VRGLTVCRHAGQLDEAQKLMICVYSCFRVHADNAVYIRSGGRDKAGAVFGGCCGEEDWSCCERTQRFEHPDCGKGLFERLESPLFGVRVPDVARWRTALPCQYISKEGRRVCCACCVCMLGQ